MVGRSLSGRPLPGRLLGGRGLGQTDGTAAPSKGGFTPRAIAGLLGWYDPSDLSTLYQDSAMTTPVTADGQPVGAMLDKSGNGLHMIQPTSTRRPVFKDQGGLRYLLHDGVDDFLSRAAVSLGGAVTFALALRKTSDATQQFAAWYDIGQLQLRVVLAAANAAAFARAASSALANISNISAGPYASPDTMVLVQRAQLSPVSHILRRNGVNVATDTSTSQGSGVYGSNGELSLGAVNNASGSLSGNIYGAAIYAANLSDADVARLDKYLGRKAGLTL